MNNLIISVYLVKEKVEDLARKQGFQREGKVGILFCNFS